MSRFVLLSLWAMFGALTSSAETATVHTVRTSGGGELSDAALYSLADEKGSVEIVTLHEGGLVTRAIVTPGVIGYGCPGFNSTTAAAAASANGASQITIPGGTLSWPKGTDSPDLETQATLNGKLIYTEHRAHDSAGRLAHVRVDYTDGSVLYQAFTYDDPAASDSPAVANGSETKQASKPGNGLEKALQTANVQFTAPPQGQSYVYDTGFWPGGGSSAGGFPVQVHIGLAATATYSAQVGGALNYNKPNLAPGAASGQWGFDFGVELAFEAAFDIGVIDPIVIDVPYVPNFDLRAQDTDNFNSYLLDTTSNLSNQTPRATLFTYDLSDLILGGLNLPSWFPLQAGAAVDASVDAAGSMTCDSISLNDGNSFTSEAQPLPITVPPAGYQASATYNEAATLSIGIHVYPSIFIEVAGQTWTLPLYDFPWTPVDGPRDLPFSAANFSVNYVPDPEGEGTAEGEGEGEGASEGEGEGEGQIDPNTTDWLTERFVGANDISNKTITFTPDASANGYAVCRERADAFPYDVTGSSALPLQQDGVVAVNVVQKFTFFGVEYDRLYISANGNVSFASGNVSANGTLAEHFSTPRISAFFKDLDPTKGGAISIHSTEQGYAITYDNIPVRNSTDTVSAQIIIAFDGTITITCLGVNTPDGIVGLSRGNGLALNYADSDLSAYVLCPGGAEGEGEGQVEGEGTAEGEGEGIAEGEGINYTCELAIFNAVPDSRVFTVPGGTGTFRIIRTNEVCIDPIFVQSDQLFVTITSGPEDYEVHCSVADNYGRGPRFATITASGFFGDMVHFVYQDGDNIEGEGTAEGTVEGSPEGTTEGTVEGALEGEGATCACCTGPYTSSYDANCDHVISLGELLRVIQLYNSLGYHCADTPGETEDGYVPGAGLNHACAPYRADYNPQDWAISLAELLRVIQLYNSLGYYECPGQGTEDGLCPGQPSV